MEAREAAGSAATRRCVRRPRLQRGRVRLLWTSRGYVPEISAPMGMGPGPKHIYTLTSRTYPRGHPKLSLGYFVTVCNRHSTLVHQGCFTFSDNDSACSPPRRQDGPRPRVHTDVRTGRGVGRRRRGHSHLSGFLWHASRGLHCHYRC